MSGAFVEPAVRRGAPGDVAVAAIDCGTNSTRLLVCRSDGLPLSRMMRITRLGQGVDTTGVLAPRAIDRTVAVLEDYSKVMEQAGVVRVRMTATSAARDAANREDFFSAAERAVGVRPELLAGAEEATLSFAGATAELPLADGPWLVADIGGGSTELSVGPADRAGSDRLVPIAARSLDIGCVRITERFLRSDPPTTEELAAAATHIDRSLASLGDDDVAFAGADTLVGLAGTVAALAALDRGLTTYDRSLLHHHLLTRTVVDELLAVLSGQTVEQRQARPAMESARADVIVGGTMVLSALLHHFDLGRCLTSESDILDGLAMSLLVGGAPRPPARHH